MYFYKFAWMIIYVDYMALTLSKNILIWKKN